MKYHVSADGMARVCRAQSEESCRATGSDGDTAPHGEFSNPEEAQRFAEQLNADAYDPWSTNSKGDYYADGVGPDESVIAAKSEAVLSGMDLAIDVDDLDSDGKLEEIGEDSSLRFILDKEIGGTASGYPAWKVYGNEADLKEFLENNDQPDLPYGEHKISTGPSSHKLVLEKIEHEV